MARGEAELDEEEKQIGQKDCRENGFHKEVGTAYTHPNPDTLTLTLTHSSYLDTHVLPTLADTLALTLTHWLQISSIEIQTFCQGDRLRVF